MGLLLAIFVGLLIYAWSHRPGTEGEEIAAATRSNCPLEDAPSVRKVSLERLGELREEISAGVIFGADLDPYEQGLVSTLAAWTDEEPSMLPLAGSEGRVPAGYEIRWWAPSGHNVLADVMLFEDAGSARDYIDRASSTHCREAATAAAAPLPDGGRNLEWRNPLGYMQQDLFLARGPRVYRLTVVAPGEVEKPTAEGRKEGFRLVNAMGAAVLGLANDLAESGSAA